MGFNSAFKGLKLLKKNREQAFKLSKWPRPQCVKRQTTREGGWNYQSSRILHSSHTSALNLCTQTQKKIMTTRIDTPHFTLCDIPNIILLYKLLLRSTITYAAPVRSSTSLTNYRHLQVYQSKCLRVIGNFPRRTPISNLHIYLQMIPICQFIYNLTDKFFVSCPAHPNPLIRNTGNYTLQDLHRQYPKIQV